MNNNLEIIREQLQQLRTREEMLFNHKANVKKWCVTIWIAILIFIITQEPSPGKIPSFLIMIPQIIFFWFMDSIYSSALLLYTKHQIDLEKRISKNNLSIEDESEIFMLSRSQKVQIPDKIHTFFQAAFTTETIVFFYLCLIFLSILTIVFLI